MQVFTQSGSSFLFTFSVLVFQLRLSGARSAAQQERNFDEVVNVNNQWQSCCCCCCCCGCCGIGLASTPSPSSLSHPFPSDSHFLSCTRSISSHVTALSCPGLSLRLRCVVTHFTGLLPSYWFSSLNIARLLHVVCSGFTGQSRLLK